MEMLFERFKVIGNVRDVFISKKFDKSGRRYRFVRFGGEVNTLMVEEKLNNVWFGTYKLRANISKFARKTENNKIRTVHEIPYKTSNNQTIHQEAFRIEKLSYSDVVGGRTNTRVSGDQRENYSPKGAGYNYESSEDDRAFLNRRFTGQLKENFLWNDIGEEVQEAGEGRMIVSYRGGDLVFIQPYGEEVLTEHDLGKIAKWFLFLEPWNERDVHNVRITRTQWYGVPMHAWNPKFFKLVLLKFSKLIRIDDATLSKRKLQYARILIRTPRSEIPKNPFTVKVVFRRDMGDGRG
ncbi:hypothetical protein ACS0TY_006046 [Phlomoides rotata]